MAGPYYNTNNNNFHRHVLNGEIVLHLQAQRIVRSITARPSVVGPGPGIGPDFCYQNETLRSDPVASFVFAVKPLWRIELGYFLSEELASLGFPYPARQKLYEEIADFAHQLVSRIPPDNVDILVDVDVCAVQKDGEEIEATRSKAMCPRRSEVSLPEYQTYEDYCNFPPISDRAERRLVDVGVSLERFVAKDEDDRRSSLIDCCSICLGTTRVGNEMSILPCKHGYHSTCIVRWLKKSQFCPLCRATVQH